MAAIYLIRHGQASFGQADYDKLSEKGCQQSYFLGQHLGTLTKATKYYAGDLLRHGQTLSHFARGAQHANVPLCTHSGFNEFDHIDILTCHQGKWADAEAMTIELANHDNPNDALQKEFSAALTRWIECKKSKEESDYQETWAEFKSRCVRALQDVINQYFSYREEQSGQDLNKDILIFTSGGTISVLVQYVLGLTDQQTMTFIQQLRNTSVTKLLFTKENLSLDYLNNYSHLEHQGQEWLTYR